MMLSTARNATSWKREAQKACGVAMVILYLSLLFAGILSRAESAAAATIIAHENAPASIADCSVTTKRREILKSRLEYTSDFSVRVRNKLADPLYQAIVALFFIDGSGETIAEVTVNQPAEGKAIGGHAVSPPATYHDVLNTNSES